MEIKAIPEELSVADSGATAQIWVTLKRGTTPIEDSTIVQFATTEGAITETSITIDGLAIGTLTGPGFGEQRDATIFAQALTVKDSVQILLFQP